MNGIINAAQVIHVCGKISGRKKLQKIVHILQSFGADFPHEFEYLHYGPYSAQLRADLDQLEQLGLITETESTTSTGYAQFDCETTEDLAETLKVAGVHNPNWADFAIELNSLSPRQLESMSTILFLQSRGFEGERLRDRFESLKPALVKQFEEAVRRVDEFRSRD